MMLGKNHDLWGATTPNNGTNAMLINHSTSSVPHTLSKIDKRQRSTLNSTTLICIHAHRLKTEISEPMEISKL